MIKRIICLLVVILLSSMTMWAQKYEQTPKKWDWWLGGSLGVTHSLAENATADDFFHNLPGLEMQLGMFFNRAAGMRLSWGLNPQMSRPGLAQREGDPETYDTHYRFNVMSGYLDLMLDMTRLFSRKKYRPTFDVMLFAGAGGLESFDFSHKVVDWEYYPVDYWDHLYWAAHAGFLATYRVSSRWDFMVEGSYNITDGAYDGVKSNIKIGGYLKLHLGMMFHLYDRSNNKVRLATADDTGWTPSYTEKDRERARDAQRKRLARARKETEKRQANRAKEVQRKNEEAQKARKQQAKARKRLDKEAAEKRLYNEPTR